MKLEIGLSVLVKQVNNRKSNGITCAIFAFIGKMTRLWKMLKLKNEQIVSGCKNYLAKIIHAFWYASMLFERRNASTYSTLNIKFRPWTFRMSFPLVITGVLMFV